MEILLFTKLINIEKAIYRLLKISLIPCLVAGCVATPKERGVEIGMTQSEVHEIMGKPGYKSSFNCPKGSRNCPEVWRYDGYNISFSDGIVDAVQ